MLGYGSIASEHARVLEDSGCSLASVMGPSAESARAFAREFGFSRWTTEVDDVVTADDVDVVVVASPSEVHAGQTLRAVRAGKHVLCEVPLAMSLVDAQTVAEAVTGAGVTAMVCHSQRFFSPVSELLGRVAAGELSVTHIVHCTCISRRENIGWTGRRRSWVDNILWHHGAHAVDLALELVDDEAEFILGQSGDIHEETGLPMELSMAIRFRCGSLASLVLSYNGDVPPINELIVVAREGTFRIENGELIDQSGTSRPTSDVSSAITGAVRAQDDAFLRAVRAGGMPSPTPAELVPAYAALQEISEQLEPSAT